MVAALVGKVVRLIVVDALAGRVVRLIVVAALARWVVRLDSGSCVCGADGDDGSSAAEI